MKILIRFNLGFRAIVASIHSCDGFAKAGEMPIVAMRVATKAAISGSRYNGLLDLLNGFRC
jgi:hypothetical protein